MSKFIKLGSKIVKLFGSIQQIITAFLKSISPRMFPLNDIFQAKNYVFIKQDLQIFKKAHI